MEVSTIVTEEDRDIYRRRILRTLKAAYPHAMKANDILVRMESGGFEGTSTKELEAECEGLLEGQLIAVDTSNTNGAVKKFKLTEKGRIALAGR